MLNTIELHVTSTCRWGRSVLMLQSGQLTCQQSLKKPGDASAWKSTTSSSARLQSSASSLQSWDLALLLSSRCLKGPCRWSRTKARRRPDCRACRRLWSGTGACSWTVLTPKEEKSLNTSSRIRMVDAFQDVLKVFPPVDTGDISAEAKQFSFRQSSDNENVNLCDPDTQGCERSLCGRRTASPPTVKQRAKSARVDLIVSVSIVSLTCWNRAAWTIDRDIYYILYTGDLKSHRNAQGAWSCLQHFNVPFVPAQLYHLLTSSSIFFHYENDRKM